MCSKSMAVTAACQPGDSNGRQRQRGASFVGIKAKVLRNPLEDVELTLKDPLSKGICSVTIQNCELFSASFNFCESLKAANKRNIYSFRASTCLL